MNTVKAVKDGVRDFFEKHPLAVCPITAFLLSLLAEGLNSRSPFGGIILLFTEPAAFLVGFFVFLTVLSVSAFFHRHTAVYVILTFLLSVPGIVNLICLLLRNSPFQCFDVLNFVTCFDIIFVYLSWTDLIVLGIAIVLILILFTILFIKAPAGCPVPLKKAAAVFFSSLIVTAVLLLGFQKTGAVPARFEDIKGTYRQYGFSYCFFVSLYDRGVKKPEDYSGEAVHEIIEEVSEEEKQEADDGPEPSPNVVFLQLESFFDPTRVKGLTLTEDPTPCFRSLTHICPHGFLSVPSIGGGTANTEFEILTGMDLTLFGVGEYPYSSVLLDTPCESAASDLSEIGYRTHAIHNHIGTFYNRSTVYPNLGFDTFQSIEYMNGIETNPLGWAKDKILTNEILRALDSTAEKDFIFAVSVQGHGRYPEKKEEEDDFGPIGAEFSPDRDKDVPYRYYVNQIAEMDRFLSELISFLSDYPEEVLLVLYGDHLPPLDLREEDLNDGRLYATEYVIWSNRTALPQTEKDIETWQLFPYTFSLAGITNGTINLFQQYSDPEDPDFEEDYQTLIYDMLYGDRNVYEGDPPEAHEMQMGTLPVEIDSYSEIDGDLYLSGTGFTGYSVISVNGWNHDTIFLTTTLIKAPNVTVGNGDAITVRQITQSFGLLGETEEFIAEE